MSLTWKALKKLFRTVPDAEEIVDLAIEFSGPVVGIDLCGNPEVGDAKLFAPGVPRDTAIVHHLPN